MTTFFIMRHGETEWNRDHNRYCGISDIPLSASGIEQAKAAANLLKGISFDSIYTSPLIRAQQTANILKDECLWPMNIETDDRLTEIDFGMWEGYSKDQIECKFPDNWNAWNDDPTFIKAGDTGETAETAFNRIQSFFHETSIKHPDSTILVVAHNTVNRLFIAGTLGLHFKDYRKIVQSNTGLSILDVHQENYLWQQINCKMHLL